MFIQKFNLVYTEINVKCFNAHAFVTYYTCVWNWTKYIEKNNIF